jgi:hypothetical protein
MSVLTSLEQDNSGNCEDSNFGSSRFSTNDISQVQLNKKFSILDTLEGRQQTPFLLKHEDMQLR